MRCVPLLRMKAPALVLGLPRIVAQAAHLVFGDVVERGVVHPVKPAVQAAACHQRVMAAGRDDPAVLQHDDPVGAADGGQAVGDDQGGATLQQRRQRALDFQLGVTVSLIFTDQSSIKLSFRRL